MIRSLAPALLLSMPQMLDPNFIRSVILLCKHSEDGAFGLVLNRPLVTTGTVMVHLDPPVSTDRELDVWIGGPVEPQRTWVLMSDSLGPDDEHREVCPGVLLSVSESLTLSLLQGPPSSRFRVLAGYAGWGPGQLDRELTASEIGRAHV